MEALGSACACAWHAAAGEGSVELPASTRHGFFPPWLQPLKPLTLAFPKFQPGKKYYTSISISSWWCQPPWNIWVRMGSSSPNRGEYKNNIWNHQPVLIDKYHPKKLAGFFPWFATWCQFASLPVATLAPMPKDNSRWWIHGRIHQKSHQLNRSSKKKMKWVLKIQSNNPPGWWIRWWFNSVSWTRQQKHHQTKKTQQIWPNYNTFPT